MGINLGSAGITSMFVGSTNVLRAYQGAVEVFSSFPFDPSLVIDYVINKSFQNGESFSRASPATFVDELGIIKFAGVNAPRFGHDPTTLESLGFLSENEKTNFAPNSEALGSWDAAIRNNLVLTENDETAPDGLVTADTLTENTATGTHFWGDSLGAGIAAGEIATVSVFFKRTSGTRNIKIGFSDGVGNGCRAVFDGATGVFLADQSFGNGSLTRTYDGIQFPNGWIRIAVTGVCSTANAADQARVYLMDGTTENYAGDGSSALAVWGFQVEHNSASNVASALSSYIPTAGATVTRSADGAGQGAIIDPFIFPDPFTVMVESTPIPMAAVDQSQLGSIVGGSVSAADESNRFDIRRDDGATINLNFSSAAGAGSDFFENTPSPEVKYRAAMRIALNDKNYAVNGAAGTADTTTAQPTGLSRLAIGSFPLFSVRNAEAHIGRVVFWDKALTDLQLEEVTTLL